MIVVDPITITESNFYSSTIQEPDISTGEQEWLENPNVGYDISAQGGSPRWIEKNKGDDSYHIFDTSNHKLTVYDKFFNYVRESGYGVTKDYDCIGTDYTTTLSQQGQCGMMGFQYSSLNNVGSTLVSINLTSKLGNEGITTIDPVGVLTTVESTSNRMIYILNRVSASEYRIIQYDFQNDALLSNNQLDTATHGTPVDITYRRGRYMILYSTSTNTEIVFYESTFTHEISTNQITGDVSSQPFDSFTTDATDGYHLLKTSELKVFSVTSDFRVLSSYGVGDQVIKSSVHKKYQCVIDTIQDPEIGIDEVPPTWVELGATNRWAMFDGESSYSSTASGSIDIELRPLGQVNSINIFNMSDVDSVEVTSSVPDLGVSHTETYSVTGEVDLVIYDFPPFINPFITIKFTGGDMSVGEVVVGEPKSLGTLLAGVISDRLDYSRYAYDEFGKLTYVPRPIVKYTTYPIRIPKYEAIDIERYLDDLKGKQAVWIGNMGGGDFMVTRGVLERSPMTYSNPSTVEYQIKVRGSI